MPDGRSILSESLDVAMSHPRLRILDPDEPPREVPVRDGMTLGRDASSDCVVGGGGWTSKRHARILRSPDGGWLIEDCGSSNGTRIEGGPTLREGERHPLEPGLGVSLGKVRIELCAPPPEPAAPPTAEPPEPAQPPGGTLFFDFSPNGPAAATSGTGSVEPPRPRDEAPAPAPVVPPPRKPAREPTGDIGLLLARASPRLILCGPGSRRSIGLGDVDAVLGREEGAGVDIALGAPSVSSPHARIRFDGSSFRVEDLGSTNGTSLDGVLLPAGESRPLGAGSHLRLGEVDLVFLAESPPGETPTFADRAMRTSEVLRRRRILSRGRVGRALRAAGGDPRRLPDVLLLDGLLSPAQWGAAFHAARHTGFAARPESHATERLSRRLVGTLVLLIAILLVAIAVVAVGLSRGR